MNIRQKYELKMLSEDGNMDMEKIAELFSIHLRTVRYDIQILNEYLQQKTGKARIEVTNKVASMPIGENQIPTADLNIRDFYTDRISAEERMLLMLFDLCWQEGYNTIQELADKYCVSRATVNKDIVAIKEYCEKNDISFAGDRGKGLCIKADEAERRSSLAKIIRDLNQIKHGNEYQATDVYGQWFMEEDLEEIRQIVAEAEEEFSTYLADVAYEALVLHIALSIERFRSGGCYEERFEKFGADMESIQYRMAWRIIGRLNQNFKIELPDTEVHYVALHIGAKSSAAIKERSSGDISLEYYCIRMISLVGRRIGCDFSEDEKLYESLLQHLNVCIYRKKSGMLLENPLKEELICSYPQLYREICSVVRNDMDSGMIVDSDDEIAYILLHFATAMYRKEQNRSRLADVVVVCATGIGTSELVATGLQKKFCLNIKGAVAEHQLKQFLKKTEVDLIVTTIPLREEYNSVRVSPVLKREDIARIGKRLLDLGFDIQKPLENYAQWSDTAKWLGHLLQNYAGRDQEDDLKQMLKNFPLEERKKKEGKQYMLSELLEEQSMRLDAECQDWQACIWESGKLLVEKGDITEEYIKAVIDNVNEVGPYIVITKGVALPHATNKIGVIRTSMSFVRLKTPVNFGNKSNDPVKYIFMLATTDAESHLGALQDLAEFLEQKEFVAVLEEAKKPADVISYIVTHESSR